MNFFPYVESLHIFSVNLAGLLDAGKFGRNVWCKKTFSFKGSLTLDEFQFQIFSPT
jgi:hypothetical protein